MIGGVPRFGHIIDYMRDVLHWLPVQQRIHYRISSFVWHCILGNAPSYLLELFILASISPFGLQGGISGATCSLCHQTEKGFLDCGYLFGMVFPLNFVLYRRTFPVLFINSSRLSSLAEPGLGAPLSSYLKGR